MTTQFIAAVIIQVKDSGSSGSLCIVHALDYKRKPGHVARRYNSFQMKKACPLYMPWQLWIGKKVVCPGKTSDTCLAELKFTCT
jgi:hypothetical protein